MYEVQDILEFFHICGNGRKYGQLVAESYRSYVLRYPVYVYTLCNGVILLLVSIQACR